MVESALRPVSQGGASARPEASPRVSAPAFVIAALVIVAGAVAQLAFFLRQNADVSYYDELVYLRLSRQILSQGLFAIDTTMRSYLYPLFLAELRLLFADPVHLKVAVSLVQFGLLAYTAVFLGRAAAALARSRIAGLTVLGLILLNPYLVQATTLMLTDVIAACLVALGVVAIGRADLRSWRGALAATVPLLLAVMLRNASLIFVIAGILIVALRRRLGDGMPWRRAAAAAIVAAAIIGAPQLTANVERYDHWTPLVHGSIYEQQSVWAGQNLKYATVVAPGEEPKLFYNNPLAEDRVSIFRLATLDPPAFALGVSGHLFAALDWGYVDTYIRDFYPVSRIGASFLLYGAWLLVLVGVRVALRWPSEWREPRTFLAVTLAGAAALALSFLATTCVESRFGYPVYLLAVPFAGVAVARAGAGLSRTRLAMTVVGAILFAGLCLTTSLLMDATTGRIDWLTYWGLG